MVSQPLKTQKMSRGSTRRHIPENQRRTGQSISQLTIRLAQCSTCQVKSNVKSRPGHDSKRLRHGGAKEARLGPCKRPANDRRGPVGCGQRAVVVGGKKELLQTAKTGVDTLRDNADHYGLP